MQNIEVKEDFSALHKVVKEGIETFLQVGVALGKIRDGKLYKTAGFKSFSEYCEKEFNFSDQRARQIIHAARIGEKYGVPNERVARAISYVPQEMRDEVVKRASERQDVLTTSLISDMHEELLREETPSPPANDRVQIPSSSEFDAARQHLVAAGKIIASLAKEKRGSFLPMTHLKADLKNAFNTIAASVPTHRCFSCQGGGCKVCNELGWITTEMWDRRPIEFL